MHKLRLTVKRCIGPLPLIWRLWRHVTSITTRVTLAFEMVGEMATADTSHRVLAFLSNHVVDFRAWPAMCIVDLQLMRSPAEPMEPAIADIRHAWMSRPTFERAGRVSASIEKEEGPQIQGSRWMAKTIIWVDPDTDILDPVVRPLELAGYRIVRLHTAKAAVAAVDAICNAELLLLDPIVPSGSSGHNIGHFAGLDLLQRLRKIYGVRTPAFVFTTANSSEMLKHFTDLGVLRFVRKPVLPSRLRAYIDEALGGSPI